jgi:hypothetical protein
MAEFPEFQGCHWNRQPKPPALRRHGGKLLLAVVTVAGLVGLGCLLDGFNDDTAPVAEMRVAHNAPGLTAPAPIHEHHIPMIAADDGDRPNSDAPAPIPEAEIHARADEFDFLGGLSFSGLNSPMPSIDPDIIGQSPVPARLDELVQRHAVAELREHPAAATLARPSAQASGIWQIKQAGRRTVAADELASHILDRADEAARINRMSGSDPFAQRRLAAMRRRAPDAATVR